MPLVFLSVGSNKGNRLLALAKAYNEIDAGAGRIVDSSSVYETEPWGFAAEQQFYNQVLKLESELEPGILLDLLIRIEASMGRTREEGGYQSREIDLDILLYGNLVVDSEKLKIPHPRMHLRKFVLIPLAELAENLVHPTSGIAIYNLLEDCHDMSKVIKRYNKEEIPGLFKKAINQAGN